MGARVYPRRPAWLAVVLGGVLWLSSLAWSAQGPPAANPAEAEKPEVEFGHNVKLPIDPRSRRKIQEARRLLAQQEWSQAIRLLQSLLDSKEDSFLPDEANKRHVSIRVEANRLLGTLPKEGRQFYELEFGSQAKALLGRGREEGNPELLAEVALRYQHTEAGAEATAMLGTYHLDQGQAIVAALCFERLLERDDTAPLLSPLVLFKAALAFERADLPEQRDRAFAAFQNRLNQPGAPPLPAALRGKSMQELQALLRSPAMAVSGLVDYPMLQGRPDRAGQLAAAVPFLEPRPGFPVDVTRPVKMTSVFNHDATRRLLDEACKIQLRFHQPIISGQHPLAVGDLLITRGPWGVQAFNVRTTGTLAWEHPMQAGLAAMTNAIPTAGLDMPRVNLEPSNLLFENSLIGVLSSDRQYVYAIEDLAVPPMVEMRGGPRPIGDRLGKWHYHNELVAYDLREGLPAWIVGTYEPDQPFSDCFFLGAPLPLGDKLYVLVEISGEIRLMCLVNRRTWDAAAGRHRAAPEIIWSQPLCQVNRRLPDDPGRRLHTAQIAYRDGMLICPTNAGVVLAVDLLTRSLVWAHAYQVQEETARSANVLFPGAAPFVRRGQLGQVVIAGEMASPPLGQNTWAAAAPIIHRGYVIFTAPDAKGLHVLHLRDGTLAWRRDRQLGQAPADLYLAGVDEDRVLVVGHKSIKALSLSKQGELLWETPLAGMPSGRGVLSKGQYLLPLRTLEPRERAAGEIWTIDLGTGAVLARQRVRHDVPGNLLFAGGDLVSQNVVRLTVYPQLANKEREVAERLANQPLDPVGLAQRGELKLHRGDLAAGIEDLRTALAGNWTDQAERRRARDKLFEAWCDLLERKFNEREQDLAELTALAELPATPNESAEARQKRLEEETDRKARLLRLIGRGREAQGRLKDALTLYVDFAPSAPTLLQNPDDPAVQIAPQLWIQGRIRDLFRRASPAQRAELLAAVEQRWTQIRGGELPELQRFAERFGPLLPVGREALLELGERLLQRGEFAEARLKLLYVLELAQEAERAPNPAERDVVAASQAARALDALARLNLKQNLLEDAAFYFKQLAKRYPNVPVRGGKTGAELYLELTTDKRFLPFLSQRDVQRRGLLAQPYTEITRLPPAAATASAVQGRVWATFVGHVTPLFQRHRLGVEPAVRQARLVDVNTDADRGGFALEPIPAGLYTPTFAGDSGQRPSIPAFALGQLVLFSWANQVYAFDLIEGKRRWKYDLIFAGDTGGGDRLTSLVPGPNGRFMLLHANRNVMEPVGTLALATTQQAVLLTRSGMLVVDPLTQQPLWSRDDILADAEVFGDDELLLVQQDRAQEGKRYLALRTADGSLVDGLNVPELFANRLRTVGRRVLRFSETAEGSVLRLYDPLRQVDTWSLTVRPKSTLVESLVPNVVAVAEPDGKVQAFSLTTGEQLFSKLLDSSVASPMSPLYLLADALHWYLAFALPGEDENRPARFFGPAYAAPALRTIRVNGPLLALDRSTGELRWRTDVPMHGLILEQFEELPLLLFASLKEVRVPQRGNNQGHFRNVSALLALDKRDGRVIDASESSNGTVYTALRVDAGAGRIELIGHPLKTIFQLRGE